MMWCTMTYLLCKKNIPTYLAKIRHTCAKTTKTMKNCMKRETKTSCIGGWYVCKRNPSHLTSPPTFSTEPLRICHPVSAAQSMPVSVSECVHKSCVRGDSKRGERDRVRCG